MGFTKHTSLTRHTCKRRQVWGGSKKTGSYDEAKRVGWVLMVRSTLGEFIWLWPACRSQTRIHQAATRRSKEAEWGRRSIGVRSLTQPAGS